MDGDLCEPAENGYFCSSLVYEMDGDLCEPAENGYFCSSLVYKMDGDLCEPAENGYFCSSLVYGNAPINIMFIQNTGGDWWGLIVICT